MFKFLRKTLITVTVALSILALCLLSACSLPHAHTYSDKWSSNATYHWHKATCGHTDETCDKAEHNFVNGSCDVCGYTASNNGDNTGTGGNTGAGNGGNTGGNTGNSGDNTGTGGTGNSGDSTGGSQGGNSGDNTGDNTGGNTGGDTPVVPQTYSVTFIADGVTIATVSYNEGDTSVTEPQIPAKVGYTGSWEDYTLSDSNITVYAIYTAKTYTVTLDYNGADGNLGVTQITVTFNQPIGELPTPTKTGGEFDGWYFGETLVTSADIWSTDSDSQLTFVAKWTATGTVGLEFTLNSDGVSYSVSGIGTASDKDLIIPSTHNSYPVTAILAEVFYECDSIESVFIPNSVTSIGSRAFYKCTSLKEVILGDGSQLASIGSYAFYYCSSIESIIVPSSVTSINTSAFAGCSGLKAVYISDLVAWCKVYFPNSTANPLYYAHNLYINNQLLINLEIPSEITNIKSYTFYGCSSIESVTIHEGVTLVATSPFYNCTGLVTVYLNAISCNFLENSTTQAFDGCTNLTTVVIGEDVESIKGKPFADCSSLNAVHISNLLAWLNIDFSSAYYNPLCYGHNLYLNNQLVTNLEIPAEVSTVKNYTFYGCESITNVTIPSTVTSLGSSAFGNCTGVVTVNFAGNTQLTSIGSNAFSGCISLKNFAIPSSVTSIGNYALRNCASLTTITIPEGVTSLGSYAFYGCTSLAKVIFEDNSKLASIKESTFYGCSSLTSIDIPSQVVSIEQEAFYGCTALVSVTIPESLSSVGSSAFTSCKKLVEIWNYSSLQLEKGSRSYGFIAYYAIYIYNVDEASKLVEIDGFVFDCTDSGDYLVYYSGSETELILPSKGPTSDEYSIYDNAFYCCSNLISVTIPASVTSIGDSAFNNCTSLVTVNFDGDSRLVSIDSSAFANCSSLSAITIPASVTSIGSSAFYECTDLATVTFESNIQLTTIELWIFTECSSLTSIVIPASVTQIRSFAFYKCTSLVTVTFENGSQLVSFDENAFSYCNSLTSITVPSTVISIGGNAFQCCYRLLEVWNYSSLDITKGATTNGEVAYYALYVYGVGEQSRLVEKDGFVFDCTDDGDYLVYYRGSEVQLTLPSTSPNGNKYSIYKYAFYDCGNLTHITISSGVTSIGSAAFYGCSSLTSITIPQGVTALGGSTFYGCGSLTRIVIPVSLTTIGNLAFGQCDNLVVVFYYGTADQWNNITIGSSNTSLTNATRYYYSALEPSLNSEETAYDGNYWHWADDGVTPEIWVYNKED
ncbi:MAG: leucine-rich repeat protein [Clostridiales bacterium]|nr:leucine-rich repeat protein [Clostridiales bacterium]